MTSKIVEGSIFLERLYNGFPSLENVDILDIVIKQYGPVLKIKFNLPNFPVAPPKKWETMDTVQVTLELWFTNMIFIEKFSTGNICDIKISSHESGVMITITGDSQIMATAELVKITKVEAFLLSN